MADVAPETGTYDTREQAGKDDAALYKSWYAALDLATKSEEDWFKKAEDTEKLYQAEESKTKTTSQQTQFNILYTNVETIVPALYNSRPEPDCRRRFADADEVGKLVAQITERCISVSIDQTDFDSLMLASATDSEVVGRGVPRIRYLPQFAGDGQPSGAKIDYEHISWRNVRIGPAKRWEDVPWVAFEHWLTREQLIELNSQIGGTIKLESMVEGAKERVKESKGDNPPEIFKRAHTWEIWDRESRKVIFLADSHKLGPIRIEGDPLELQAFFPIPKPLYALNKTASLTPTVPYSLYEQQANELEDITRRLKRIVKMLRWRGIRASELDSAFESMKNLDDGELASSSDAAVWSDKGIDKGIWLMPIEQAMAVAKELYEARERVKQTIYEITGVADIMRGSTDPNETLGAQKIKAQWGSLRLNRRQQEVARLARDLFRMTAEIVASKFEWQQISLMTGIKLPTQQEKAQAMQIAQMAAQQNPQQAQAMAQANPEVIAHYQQPTVEEVMQVLQRDLLREYRIDVESDSTIRADTERTQTNVANFVTGLGQFFQGIGPAVEAGYMPMDTAAALLTGFARNFKLGKQAEDALDRLMEKAKDMANQPKSDPEADKAKADIERLQAKTTAEIEGMRAKAQADIQIKREAAQNDAAIRSEEASHAADLRQQELEHKRSMATIDQGHAMMLQRQKADNEARLQQQQADAETQAQTREENGTAQIVKVVAQEAQQIGQAVGEGMAKVGEGMQQLAESQQAIAQALAAESEVIRDDKTGRAKGMRRIMPPLN